MKKLKKHFEKGAGSMLYGTSMIIICLAFFALFYQTFIIHQNAVDTQSAMDVVTDGTALYMLKTNGEGDAEKKAFEIRDVLANNGAPEIEDLKIDTTALDKRIIRTKGVSRYKYDVSGTKNKTYTIPKISSSLYRNTFLTGGSFLPDCDYYFQYPVLNGGSRITCPYGWRKLSGKIKMHYGIDFGVSNGEPVYSAADGVVVEVKNNCTDNFNKRESELSKYNSSQYNYGSGNYVAVLHDGGIKTYYKHLLGSTVSKGQTVKQGEQIGCGGTTGSSTGPHVHFEAHDLTRGATKRSDLAFDPTTYFKLTNDKKQ